MHLGSLGHFLLARTLPYAAPCPSFGYFHAYFICLDKIARGSVGLVIFPLWYLLAAPGGLGPPE